MRDEKKDLERLSEAVRSDNTEAVLKVLKSGVNPDLRNEQDSTQLMVAASCGYNNSIVALLQGRANPNLMDSVGTPLMAAAWNGHAKAISLLLKGKADPTKRTERGLSGLDSTVWSYAIERGHVDCLRALIEGKADPNLPSILGSNYDRGFTSLTLAASIPNLKCITALLAGKADPNQADFSGRTPLSLAIQLDDATHVRALLNANCVRTLLNGKADPNWIHGKGSDSNGPHFGDTPLSYAIRKHSGRVRQLIEGGAKVNFIGKDGKDVPPLFLAVSSGFTDCIPLLLEAGADPQQLVERPPVFGHSEPVRRDAISQAFDMVREKSGGALLEAFRKFLDDVHGGSREESLFVLTGLSDHDAQTWLFRNRRPAKPGSWCFAVEQAETRFYVIRWMQSSLEAGLRSQRIEDMIVLELGKYPYNHKSQFLQAAQNINRIMKRFPLDFDAAYIWHTIPETRLWLLVCCPHLFKLNPKFSGLPHELILVWIIRAHVQSNKLFLRPKDNAIPQLKSQMLFGRYFQNLKRDYYDQILVALERNFSPDVDVIFRLCRQSEGDTPNLEAYVSLMKMSRSRVSMFIHAFQFLDKYCGLPEAKEILPDNLREDEGLIRYLRKFSLNWDHSESDRACFRKFYYFYKIHPKVFDQCSSVKDLLVSTSRLSTTWDEIKNTCFRGSKLIIGPELRNILLGSLIAIESGGDSDSVKMATWYDILYASLTRVKLSSEDQYCLNFLYNNCEFFKDESRSIHENKEFKGWASYYTEQLCPTREGLPETLDQLVEDHIVLATKNLSL